MGREQLAALAEVARPQAGCFSLDQSRTKGLTQRQLLGLERSGVVRRVHPRVFQFASSELTPPSRLWAASLQAGPAATVSHEAALRANGVGHVPFEPVVVVAPGVSHGVAGIRVHRFCDVLDEHVTEIGGLRTTTVARAVVDVTSVFSSVRLADLLDRVTITEWHTTIGAISRVYRQINRRGRRNIRVLGELRDERSDQSPLLRSTLERHADELVARSALPAPVHEMPLPSMDLRPGLVDRAWPEAKLILEIDGRRWHARERAMTADRARDRAAGREGWYTARVLDEEVRDQPDLVVADLRELYEVRCSQLGAAAASAAA